MTPKQQLERLHELIGIVLAGLDGSPFSWGDGQRIAWVPKLEKVGITLVTKTQIEKRGFALKRGAKPVGSAYFGSPICTNADLFVLEVQCKKPLPQETDCWQFLDCETLTGKPPENCPNRSVCKHNALLSQNRSCNLPYQIYDPGHGDMVFECRTLLVSPHAPDEARAVGWIKPENLFYKYELNTLILDERSIPVEAKALGFAAPVAMPYWVDPSAENLIVVGYAPINHYPDYLINAGWYPAIELPYFICPDWENQNDSVSVLSVHFPLDDSRYEQAIALGWYPAQSIRV